MNIPKLFKKDTASYYGQNMYEHVEKLLVKEKVLMIVSPYIDEYYAEYLLGHSSNKEIYILSSSIKEDVAKKLRSSRFPDAARFASVLVFLNLALFYLGFFNFYLTLVSLALASLSIVSSLRVRRVHLKVPKKFVHAKMYLGSECAIEGSANLTYAGMHKNVERINIIKDQKKIKELRRQFWRMWNEL